MRTREDAQLKDFHMVHHSFVPSPLRESADMPASPVDELEAAWGSSPLDTASSPERTTFFNSAYGPGLEGRLQPPSEAVRAMARPQTGHIVQQTPAPLSPDFNALGLANLPELRHVNLPDVAVSVHSPAVQGLGLQNFAMLPAGARTVQPHHPERELIAEPEVEFRSWGRHRRQHAENGLRVTPRAEAHTLRADHAPLQRFRPEDFTLTLDDLDGQFSSEYIPVELSDRSLPNARFAYEQVLQGTTNAATEMSEENERTPQVAPPAPRLSSGEWSKR